MHVGVGVWVWVCRVLTGGERVCVCVQMAGAHTVTAGCKGTARKHWGCSRYMLQQGGMWNKVALLSSCVHPKHVRRLAACTPTMHGVHA